MDLTGFEPKYITFDRDGTLNNSQTGTSQMGEAVRPPATDLTGPYDTQTFPTDIRTYRHEEVVSAYGSTNRSTAAITPACATARPRPVAWRASRSCSGFWRKGNRKAMKPRSYRPDTTHPARADVAVILDELPCPSRVRHVCRGAMADRRGAGVCMRRPG